MLALIALVNYMNHIHWSRVRWYLISIVNHFGDYGYGFNQQLKLIKSRLSEGEWHPLEEKRRTFDQVLESWRTVTQEDQGQEHIGEKKDFCSCACRVIHLREKRDFFSSV